MLAQSAHGPFNSDDWLFEIKWDGVRAIAYGHGHAVPEEPERLGTDRAVP